MSNVTQLTVLHVGVRPTDVGPVLYIFKRWLASDTNELINDDEDKSKTCDDQDIWVAVVAMVEV